MSFQIRATKPMRAPMAVHLLSSETELKLSQEMTQVAISPEFKRVEVSFDSLPANLSALQVRFEMINAGEVWIDDLQINDTSFTPQEQKLLDKILHSAFLHRKEDNLLRCYESITGYWPRFLMRHIHPVEVARKGSDAPVKAKPTPQKQRFFDRLKLPRMPSFRFP